MQRPAPFCIFTIIWISCRPGARRHRNWLPSYKAALNHSAAQADLRHFAFARTRRTWSCDGRRKKERQKRRLTAVSACSRWHHDTLYCLFSVKKKEKRRGGEPDRDTNQMTAARAITVQRSVRVWRERNRLRSVPLFSKSTNHVDTVFINFCKTLAQLSSDDVRMKLT